MIIDGQFREFVEKESHRIREKAIDDDKILQNLILLVTTGAFGLSINFLINKGEILSCTILLKLSWLLLAISIISNGLGYYLSRKSNTEIFNFLNNKISIDNKENFIPDDYHKYGTERLNSSLFKSIKVLNIISFLSFAVGVLLLTIFSIHQI